MAMKAIGSLARDVETAEPPHNAPPIEHGSEEDKTGTTLVLPRVHADGSHLAGRKDVRELQAMIEQAFALLDEAAEEEGGIAAPVPAVLPADKPRMLGAAAGSEIRYRSSWAGRLFKTFAGTAIVVAVGLIPLQRVTTLVSNQAYVDAPVYLLKAPAAGVFRKGQLTIGALVAHDVPLALIESPAGSAHDTAVVSAMDGKVWDVRFQSGERVAKGDLIARIVGCSATSVVASVSEGVYDKLLPGMPARFNFYGSDHFHRGTVGNLLGRSAASGDYAISPFQADSHDYRVVVSLPDLGALENCAVGRRGTVVFGRQAF